MKTSNKFWARQSWDEIIRSNSAASFESEKAHNKGTEPYPFCGWTPSAQYCTCAHRWFHEVKNW